MVEQTDIAGLIERLNRKGRNTGWHVNPDGPEAATEIEALLDRIAKLEAKLVDTNAERIEVELLLSEAADRIAKLEAEGDALREALKTIAGNPEPDPDIAPIYDPRWSAEQCRAIARAALEAKHV